MNDKDFFELVFSILVLSFLAGVVFFLDARKERICQADCLEQYGRGWASRVGLYESCTCVGVDGTIKGTR